MEMNEFTICTLLINYSLFYLFINIDIKNVLTQCKKIELLQFNIGHN